MAAEWRRFSFSTIPLMVCVTRDSLRGGSELTYNYDSHSGTYTVGPEEAECRSLNGQALRPCLCSRPCPLGRFLP